VLAVKKMKNRILSLVIFVSFLNANSLYSEVLLGVEVLEKENFSVLRNKRVGLVTNHTGRRKDGKPTVEVLQSEKAKKNGVKLVAIFSPEHGFYGVEDTYVGSSTYTAFGIPIYSLYGEVKKPTKEMLKNIDVLVFDIQDIGTRFYTYTTTMALCMEAAKENNILFVVLDRPNPITGEYVEGNLQDKEFLKMFGSYFPLPVRHGMTVGELALLFNREYGIRCKLKVVKMEGWRRNMWFDETGIPWVNPSPNMRSLDAAILYPGTAYFEAGTNVTEGRGTEKPFQYIGAPFINPQEWAIELTSRNISGVAFEPITFTPAAYKYKNEECFGVYVKITDRSQVKPVYLGLHMVDSVLKLYPDKFILPEKFNEIAGTTKIREKLLARAPVDEIVRMWEMDLQKFMKVRKKYLLYK
jgi:uncharacterized protein YbbC (DUF1343 family)